MRIKAHSIAKIQINMNNKIDTFICMNFNLWKNSLKRKKVNKNADNGCGEKTTKYIHMQIKSAEKKSHLINACYLCTDLILIKKNVRVRKENNLYNSRWYSICDNVKNANAFDNSNQTKQQQQNKNTTHCRLFRFICDGNAIAHSNPSIIIESEWYIQCRTYRVIHICIYKPMHTP